MTTHVAYHSPGVADKYLTIGFGNTSKYPEPTDSYLGTLADRMSSAVNRALNVVDATALLDKVLKLADAALKLTRYISPDAYLSAKPMHKGVGEVRGWIGAIKVPGGLWRVIGDIRNLWDLTTKTASKDAPININARGWIAGDSSKAKYHQKITDAALQRLAIIHQSLSVLADSLYTAAFTSKTFMFIDSKYRFMKEKMYHFSKAFPKIFFGLHIVSFIKAPVAIKLEHETFRREMAKSFSVDGTQPLGKQLAACQKRRVMEITHTRNQVGHVVDLLKTCFEFVRDGAHLSRTTNPVVDLVGVTGVAIFDFAGTWLKTM